MREGIEIAFTVMGDANQDLLVDLAERHGIRIVKCRHEQNAVAMADGYCRFSDDRIGLALVTMGPGLTNTATSLACAKAHRSSVLLIAGAASQGELNSPQWFDQLSFSRLLAGEAGMLESTKSFGLELDRAFGHVRRCAGPYVLNLPGNLQNAETPAGWTYRPAYSGHRATVSCHDDIEHAARVLVDAHCPAIVAGRGAVLSKAAQEIIALANLLQAPISTTLPAKGLCSGHPLWVGVCGGLGEGVAPDVIAGCDVVLAIGASMNQWTTHRCDLVRGKTVIQIDTDSTAFGRHCPADLILPGDARANLAALLDVVKSMVPSPRRPDPEVADHILSLWTKHCAPIDYDTGEDDTIDPRQVIRELDRLLPADRVVVAAGGHAGFSICQLLSVQRPQNWNYTIDFGSLGQGLGTAIGAAFARPGVRICHITADGEFMMNLQDFHTAVNCVLPLWVFILNDQGFGQERHDLEHKNLPAHYAMQASPDFARLAEGFGAKGFRFDTPNSLKGLEAALFEADTVRGPVIFDFRINGAYESPVSQEIAKALA